MVTVVTVAVALVLAAGEDAIVSMAQSSSLGCFRHLSRAILTRWTSQDLKIVSENCAESRYPQR